MRCFWRGLPAAGRVSSGRVEGGTWAAGRSSLSRPLEIFLEGEGSRGSFDERDS